ncbi:MAG: hypothetical protein VKL60_16795, partial [Sphaerospermopsis sp.]|nr:hypothetical protein [Sphaerospermopsis sp.]
MIAINLLVIASACRESDIPSIPKDLSQSAVRAIPTITSEPITEASPVQTHKTVYVFAPDKEAARIALAKHLKQIGAKVYETDSCTMCRWQRSEFG